MKKTSALFAVLLVILLGVGPAFADFQYSETSKITGGSMVTMTKSLGVFSKNARSITEPQTTIHSLKGNRLRMEHSDGRIEIIDLDAKRFINIDNAKKTYSSMTFAEMKEAIARAQQRMQEEMDKASSKHPEAGKMKMTPKLSSEATGATRTILGLNTNELKTRMDMTMENDDPKTQAAMQNMSYSFRSDAWLAPEVPGHEQLRDFFEKMAREMDWAPGQFGAMGQNPMLGQAMTEFRKNAAKLKGLPLLQNVSFGLEGMTLTPDQQAKVDAAQKQGQAQQAQQDSSLPTSARDAITKGLGGMMGGFGRKKKQDATPATDASASGAAAGQPVQSAQMSNSMMDMTIEVTSYNSNSLDRSLFEIPAGYTQVQSDMQRELGGKQ